MHHRYEWLQIVRTPGVAHCIRMLQAHDGRAALARRIRIDFEANHAIMDHGSDEGDIERHGLSCGARDDVKGELLARASLATGCIPRFA